MSGSQLISFLPNRGPHAEHALRLEHDSPVGKHYEAPIGANKNENACDVFLNKHAHACCARYTLGHSFHYKPSYMLKNFAAEVYQSV